MNCRLVKKRYTARIADGGALLAETRLLLLQWDPSIDIEANLNQARLRNTIGKASRDRVGRVVAAFTRRYARDLDGLAALVVLAQSSLAGDTLDRLLCFCALREDPLLMDVVLHVIAPAHAIGQNVVRVDEVADWIAKQQAAGMMGSSWSDSTIRRVASGLLSTLRDFGLLEGRAHKRTRPVFMSAEACSLMSFMLYRDLNSGELVINDPAWSAFYMGPLDVERALIDACGRRLLHYSAAGSVKRIDYPVEILEAYACVVTQREN